MRPKALIPKSVRRLIKRLRFLGRNRYCPVCNKHARTFLKAGVVPRPDAKCPWCGSLERHRLVWCYFQEQTDLFDGQPKEMLHVAPEDCLKQRLANRIGRGYLTADLHDTNVMEQMDITDIQHPDDSFDVIYCSHVLEHVPDDRRAMAELHRVLRPDGWAVLLVPITATETIEDPTVDDPAERLRLFGQENHVRRYGPDYADRLREAGFQVDKSTAADFLDAQEMQRIAVQNEATGDIFYCTK